LKRKDSDMSQNNFLWNDRKRYLGLPISFTKYRLSEDRLFRETGLLNTREEEVLLYRVRDLELKISLFQRIFGVGTVCVHSSDKTAPHMDVVNVKNPRDVKELIYQKVESAKDKRRMRTTELLSDDQFEADELDSSCEME